MKERVVESFDGTRLACYETGHGPTLVLANGLGGTWTAWRHLVDYFSDRFRIVSWDYRGLYRSGPSRTPGAFDMGTQVRDALVVADAFDIADAIWIGWSMGVQLNFEIVAREPGRVRALVVINGAWGRPFDTALNWRGSRYVMPFAAEILSRHGGLVTALGARIAQWKGLIGLMKRTRLVGPTLDESVFRALARDFGGLDPHAYFSTFKALGDHDAGESLERIRCPALILAGDRDPMTPRDLAERMARRIPGAEILIVPGGTHYVPVEYPELMNLRLEKFFREHDLFAKGDRPAAGSPRASAPAPAGAGA